jgi:GTPase SAR1 family protein
MLQKIKIDGALSQNRAEEQGNDLWEDFVIPPFYDKLDLLVARKPRVIIGGRGCGKTMLLKYLSHNSQFSKKRQTIPKESVSHIGLFWRMDTHFASMLTKRNITEDVWINAFEHIATILIGIEVLRSLHSIANSKFADFNISDVEKLDLESLKGFDAKVPGSAEKCESYLKGRLMEFQTWLNNVKKVTEPIFLPMLFIKELISEIRKQFPILKDVNYFVYLDEYENLLPSQQKIINTWLKHSEMPLIFNLAMKRNSFNERGTIGNEALVDINDYRTFDLEGFYGDENTFDSFAAEILFLRLSKNNSIKELPINPVDLRDVLKLSDRNIDEYKTKVISSAQKMFPAITQNQLARSIFEDKILKERLETQIDLALKFRNSKLNANKFLKAKAPEACIVIPSLLYRKREQPIEILNELNKLLDGEDNHFTGKRGWVHNFFMGSVILLYEPLNRICPIYSGFKTFCRMSCGNLRYLLELCHRSISNAEIKNVPFKISTEYQIVAAKETSASFLGEVRYFGSHGNQLHTFVLRLGGLFHHGHKRKTQSEPEPTHFSIVTTTKVLEEKHYYFLNEALKWSVLFETQSTKDKSLDTESSEYILNPIYAPYFKISYRKGRKLKISGNDFIKLIDGTVSDYEKLLKNYISKWEVDIDSGHQSLFSELNLVEE